ncbi:MAG: hypothetical protein ABSB73_09745 [Solirubrobacteraceae bacterium]
MSIEAVVTCVGFDDFLAETLPLNKHQFRRMVVVTSPEDERTQRVCEYHHVQCEVTDAFGSHWGEFNKGAGVNVGLAALDLDGWVCHLDADIALPPQFAGLLECADLDPSMIYGVDRHMIADAQAWAAHRQAPRLQQENDVYVHVDAYPLGTRIAQTGCGGWIPIGFCQIWNPLGSGQRFYPADDTMADHSDMAFAKRWPRAKRSLLGEIVAYHLQSEPQVQGANWGGRTTARFGASADPPAANAMPGQRRHRRHRHHHPHPGPYGNGGEVAS